MADFSGQLPAPTNGVESSLPLGHSQGLPTQEQPQQGLPQGLQVPGQYGAPGMVYPPPQYLPPQLAAQAENLRQFWHAQLQEIHQVGTDPAEFKNHQLPLARIKKIMKSDEDVRMISAEAPVLFARACEMFILELTLRSWSHSEENKRRTLQRNDIAAAITRTDIFDFLVDIVPRDERGDDSAASRPQAAQAMPGAPPGMPHWQQPMMSGPSGSEQLMGARPPMQMDPAMMHFYMQPNWQPPGLPGHLPGIPQSTHTQQPQQQQPSFEQQQQQQQNQQRNTQEPATKPN